MDPAFESRLMGRGIGKDVVKVLEQHKVLSLRVFRAMKEDHIVRLLQCSDMAIGEHALLWELWEKEYAAISPSASRKCTLHNKIVSTSWSSVMCCTIPIIVVYNCEPSDLTTPEVRCYRAHAYTSHLCARS